jgi:hypothetical protein
MKLLFRLGIALALLLVLVLGAGWLFLGSLVGTAIEKGSTYATGVETRVGHVDASLFSGRFGIDDLSLANPPGFRPEPFFQLRSARAAWENGTLLSDRIEMDELILDGVDVNLERAGGGTNYGAILDHLESISAGGQSKSKPDASAGGRALTIHRIEIRNVRAGLHLTGVPLASGSTEVTIPSIVLNDFSSDGSTTELVAKLTKVLLQAILEEVLRGGKGIFPADILKDLGGPASGRG